MSLSRQSTALVGLLTTKRTITKRKYTKHITNPKTNKLVLIKRKRTELKLSGLSSSVRTAHVSAYDCA